MSMKSKTFKFVSTSGHGYLVVPNEIIRHYLHALIYREQLDDVNYSFWNKKNCYLEEDSEAQKFVEWYKEYTSKEVKYNCVHQDSIRKSYGLRDILNNDLEHKTSYVL